MASADEQSRRNEEIRVEHAAGRALKDIAADRGMSYSRVKEIAAQPRPARAAMPKSAIMELAEARRAELDEAVGHARRLAKALTDAEASAQTGATRLWMEGIDRQTKLDQALGYLPRELDQVGDDLTVVRVTADVLREHDVPTGLWEDWVDRVEGRWAA